MLKRNKQSKSKQEPDNSSTTSREEVYSTAHSCNKKYQDLVEEVNTKRRLGYKMIEDSDWPNKLEVIYQQTVQLLEEDIPKKLERQNKLVPYQSNLIEEPLKEARMCKARLDNHWLSYITKDKQIPMNAEQSNAT